tara:strand:+ start:255 stop:614 length:360 start_codon:yes stop_codon:yes gene_type:complete
MGSYLCTRCEKNYVDDFGVGGVNNSFEDFSPSTQATLKKSFHCEPCTKYLSFQRGKEESWSEMRSFGSDNPNIITKIGNIISFIILGILINPIVAIILFFVHIPKMIFGSIFGPKDPKK